MAELPDDALACIFEFLVTETNVLSLLTLNKQSYHVIKSTNSYYLLKKLLHPEAHRQYFETQEQKATFWLPSVSYLKHNVQRVYKKQLAPFFKLGISFKFQSPNKELLEHIRQTFARQKDALLFLLENGTWQFANFKNHVAFELVAEELKPLQAIYGNINDHESLLASALRFPHVYVKAYTVMEHVTRVLPERPAILYNDKRLAVEVIKNVVTEYSFYYYGQIPINHDFLKDLDFLKQVVMYPGFSQSDLFRRHKSLNVPITAEYLDWMSNAICKSYIYPRDFLTHLPQIAEHPQLVTKELCAKHPELFKIRQDYLVDVEYLRACVKNLSPFTAFDWTKCGVAWDDEQTVISIISSLDVRLDNLNFVSQRLQEDMEFIRKLLQLPNKYLFDRQVYHRVSKSLQQSEEFMNHLLFAKNSTGFLTLPKQFCTREILTRLRDREEPDMSIGLNRPDIPRDIFNDQEFMNQLSQKVEMHH